MTFVGQPIGKRKTCCTTIQLTCSYMQAPGNAVEGLGHSGGTPGSRCPPFEQPTPLPPPKDNLPFRTLFVCLSLGRPLSLDDLLEDLSWWPSAAPGRPGVSSSCLAGTGKQGSIPSWTRVQNWPPAPNAHPCPRSSHGRSNLTLLHPKKCTLDAMRNKLWESEKYSWTSTVGLSLSKCPFLPPHSSHGQSDSTALRGKERESEKYSWTMKWKCSSLHPAPPKGGLTWLYCIRAGKNWV